MFRLTFIIACAILAQAIPVKEGEDFQVDFVSPVKVNSIIRPNEGQKLAPVPSIGSSQFAEESLSTPKVQGPVPDKNRARIKRQTEILNLDDIETIVTVKNNRIGTEKKFYFKNEMKIKNGQRYSCKIGLKINKLVIYNRCIWVGTADSLEVTRNVDEDFFNVV